MPPLRLLSLRIGIIDRDFRGLLRLLQSPGVITLAPTNHALKRVYDIALHRGGTFRLFEFYAAKP
jgi:hypothetical protein